MISLIYASSAVQLFTPTDLGALLEAAQKNNRKLDVSGLLLYKDGNFMQVLEGEPDVVHALYEKVKKDPRHKGFIKLVEEKITERHFPDWSMGFKNLGDKAVELIEGYRDYRDTSLMSPDFTENPTRAKKLLEAFREGR